MHARIVLTAAIACALSASAAIAQEAGAQGDAKSFTVSANFQAQVPVDANAKTADLTKALAQANQALGELANRECDVLAAAFKADCRVLQLNMDANVNERRNRQMFNNEYGGMQHMVSASLNATFALTPLAATKPAAQ